MVQKIYDWMMMLGSIVGIILIFYGGLVGLLYVFQERLVYFPVRSIWHTPNAVGLAYEAVQFTAEDGVQLSGWFVPADGADDVLLFFHGNGGNISHRLESIEQFHRLGLSVLIIDYRGYGQSAGQPTEQGTYLDAAAAWRYLTEDRHYRPEQIIIFGRSLGGAVAAWLAERHPPRLLILESTFTSIPDMAVRQFPFVPVRPLARVQYNTLARLPHLEAPVLIIHSPDDEVVPYQHGQTLFAAANEPKRFLEIRGGHNDGYLVSAQAYETGVAAFIADFSP